MKELLAKEVSTLNVNKKIIKILQENNILTVYELCNCSRIILSEKGFLNEQINEIIVALQLLGLDLKKNHAKRNTIIEEIKHK